MATLCITQSNSYLIFQVFCRSGTSVMVTTWISASWRRGLILRQPEARLLLRRLPKICSGKTSEASSNPLFGMCLLKGDHLAKHCSFLRFPSVLESTLVCALALRAVLL